MTKILRDYGFLALLSGLIIILDQWTKSIVRTQLEYGEIWAPWDWMLPFIRVVHAQNSGAAFGLMQGMAVVFTILAVIVVGAILYYFPKVAPGEHLMRLALAMQLGGATGNLIDRLTQSGYVTDFISVGTFPVFNLADASISVGVALLIFTMWFKERGKRSSSSLSDPDSEEA